MGTETDHAPAPAPGVLDRRSLIGRVGAGMVGAAAVGALAAGGTVLPSVPARAQTVTDADILNFALNLEYLEAEYYLHAFLGQSLPASDVSGTGTPGAVLGGTQVPFRTASVFSYAERLVVDEVNHVRFLRRALGSAAVARPFIDLLNSFNTLAAAAGLVAPGTQFNPFLNEQNFLLGAFVFEDVGVTAYAGAAASITSKDYLSAAASILAVEAYHAGNIRTQLANLGLGASANAISAVRAQLGGGGEQGVTTQMFPYNQAAADSDSLAFRRTPQQVLNIVYAGVSTGGGFLPNQANGTIR